MYTYDKSDIEVTHIIKLITKLIKKNFNYSKKIHDIIIWPVFDVCSVCEYIYAITQIYYCFQIEFGLSLKVFYIMHVCLLKRIEKWNDMW